MKIVIETPDEELKEAVRQVIAKQYYADYSMDRNAVRRVTAENEL